MAPSYSNLTLEVMTYLHHQLEPRHVLGCLDVGLRVCIVYEYGDIDSEYHFVKARVEEQGNYEVLCIYYNSYTTDPLKTCGTRFPLHAFDAILIQKDYYYVGNRRFIRKGMYALPYDWYCCFETHPSGRILDITSEVERGKKVGEDLYAERQRQLHPTADN